VLRANIHRLSAALLLIACHAYTTERAGNFDIRSVREDALGHSRTTMSLVYHRRTLTNFLTDWSVDPRNPDRIIYASRKPCGTFLFDGATGRTSQLEKGPVVVHAASTDSPDFAASNPWSPDGQYFFIDNDISEPAVVELRSGARVDLTDAVSVDRRRLDMNALQWSPDGQRVAVVLQPGGYNDPDRDLVAITLSPLQATYVATMTEGAGHGRVLWTTQDFHWDRGQLVTSAAGVNAAIMKRPPDQIRWTTTTPPSWRQQRGYECY